jgi:hypothetical protein
MIWLPDQITSGEPLEAALSFISNGWSAALSTRETETGFVLKRLTVV